MAAAIIGVMGLGAILAAALLLPFVSSDSGFIRTFDFPRSQIAALIAPVMALSPLVTRASDKARPSRQP